MRLLVRLPNWLGDLVMALPALEMLRRGYPEATLVAALPRAFAPIFDERVRGAPDEVVPLEARGEAAALSRARADCAILFTGSFGSAWTLWRAGVKARWGYGGRLRRPLLSRVVPRPRGRVHQIEWYRALARALGGAEAPEVPAVEVTGATRARADAALAEAGVGPADPVVVFAPGAAYGYAKRWPPRYVAAVVERLARDRGAACVLVGTAADRDTGREIESALGPAGAPAPGRLVNLIGRTDLRLLLGVLARAAAVCSNDSGAMHLAAAVGTPVVAVFGPTDERATAPAGHGHAVLTADVFCRPCLLRECPIDHRCMIRIDPPSVYRALVARIEARGAGA
jgi:heptosyltransferase-2